MRERDGEKGGKEERGRVEIYSADMLVANLFQMWQCADLFCTKAVVCSEAVAVESGSEADLLDALYNIGPIR